MSVSSVRHSFEKVLSNKWMPVSKERRNTVGYTLHNRDKWFYSREDIWTWHGVWNVKTFHINKPPVCTSSIIVQLLVIKLQILSSMSHNWTHHNLDLASVPSMNSVSEDVTELNECLEWLRLCVVYHFKSFLVTNSFRVIHFVVTENHQHSKVMTWNIYSINNSNNRYVTLNFMCHHVTQRALILSTCNPCK